MSKIRFTFEVPDGARIAHILAGITRAKGNLVAIGTVDADGAPPPKEEAHGAPKANGDAPGSRFKIDREQVLAALGKHKSKPVKLGELAKELGVTSGSVSFHLTRLRAAKQVKSPTRGFWVKV